MSNPIYIPTGVIRKQYNLSATTIRNWDKQNLVSTIRTPGGHRLYNKETIEALLGHQASKETVCYARVSSQKQKEDLERQIEYLKEKYPRCRMYSDIGSGLNFNRKDFKTILEQICKGVIGKVVVTYKDRLCRFGFELIENICKIHECEILVLNKDLSESESELKNDLLSVVTFFTAQYHGKRSHKYKKERKDTLSSKADK